MSTLRVPNSCKNYFMRCHFTLNDIFCHVTVIDFMTSLLRFMFNHKLDVVISQLYRFDFFQSKIEFYFTD